MQQIITNYFVKLNDSLKFSVVNGESTDNLPNAFTKIIELFDQCHEGGNTVWFIGNGGSSSIASHMAIDYSKNGGIRAMAFNDVAAITCMGNDVGYENIFAQQLEYQFKAGDILVAISSSGKSPNILNAVNTAKKLGRVITLSGFSPDNPLREAGNINFYIPATEYGLVEICHLTILHCILDIICGVA